MRFVMPSPLTLPTTLRLIDVMKFHHFGQLLLDSNCLLLILKMFGLQEVATTVVAKNESPDHKCVNMNIPLP